MIAIIPARFGSTRLPGKPLLDIGGRPMIAHVVARAQESGAARVVVATDDERIQQAVDALGVETVMTAATHASGTDRLAEAVKKLRIGANEIVVNVQGDEPLIPPALIRQVADTLAANSSAGVATACHAITDPAEFNSPNVVKVVRDSNGFALYFSRAPIPFPRNKTGVRVADSDPGFIRAAYRHIGIYAYRAGFIARYASWPACPLEEIEALEQLRVLWYGERIAVCEAATAPPAGVDTQDDLDSVRRLLA
jgi:3-deoxy-manno-octulosonate cytidylyltransferase (CMP-KDO synthetase)